MILNDEAKLLVVANGKDEDGYPITTKTEIPIFVQERSVTRSEFYEALKAGIRVQTVLLAWWDDFESSAHMVGSKKEYASQIEYDGSIYDIVRTYRDNNKSMVEIVCG